MKTEYTEPALSIEEQIELLRSRRMLIEEPEEDRVHHYLLSIGYYRLSYYFHTYYCDKVNKVFVENTKFDDVLQLYIFDRELRLLVLDAIERIEVAFKAAFQNEMCVSYGSVWYSEAEFYKKKADRDYVLGELKRKIGKQWNDALIERFKKNYNNELPPQWIANEILTFGVVSSLYNSLISCPEKKNIAKIFRLNYKALTSWIRNISFIRNICAHHSRLWNRNISVPPLYYKNADIKKIDVYFNNPSRLFCSLSIISYFMKLICDGSHWQCKIAELVKTRPEEQVKRMGFPDNFVQLELWC